MYLKIVITNSMEAMTVQTEEEVNLERDLLPLLVDAPARKVGPVPIGVPILVSGPQLVGGQLPVGIPRHVGVLKARIIGLQVLERRLGPRASRDTDPAAANTPDQPLIQNECRLAQKANNTLP